MDNDGGMNGIIDSAIEGAAGAMDFDRGGEEEGNEPAPSGDNSPAPSDSSTPPKVRQAPKSWAKEFHDPWTKLDPRVQDYLERREKESEEGILKYSNAYKQVEPIWKAVQAFNEDIQAMGTTPDVALRALFNAHRMLTLGTPEQKREMFARLSRDYGVDLAQFAVENAARSEGAPTDPALKAINDRLSGIEQQRQREQEILVANERARIDKEITSFRADPKHPHFDAVSDQIALLLANPQISLAQAYEMAVWAHPVVREKMVEASIEERRKKAEEEAEKARKAKGTRVKDADNGKERSEPLGTIEQTMRDTYRRMNAK